MKVQIKKLHPDAVIPSYAKDGDAGMDMTCVAINPTKKYIEYETGIAMKIPEGHVGLLFPRSSNSKMDLLLCNSVGVVDCIPKNMKLLTKKGYISLEEIIENKITNIYSYNIDGEVIEEDNITDLWEVGIKDTLKFKFEDGSQIEVTVNQLVLTEYGWKKAKDLRVEDNIISI